MKRFKKKNLENTRDDPSKEFLLERKRKKIDAPKFLLNNRKRRNKPTLTTPRVIHALSFPSPRRKEGRKERKEGRNEAMPMCENQISRAAFGQRTLFINRNGEWWRCLPCQILTVSMHRAHWAQDIMTVLGA